MKKTLIAAVGLLLTGWGCASEAPKIPDNTVQALGPTSIIVNDQEVVNGELRIDRAEFSQDVWLVVQADDNGQPGTVVGRATYSGKLLSNLKITLAKDTNSPILYISLRADDGSKGQYEPATQDKLLYFQGETLTKKINATYKGSSNKPAVDQNPQVYQDESTSTPTEINLDLKI